MKLRISDMLDTVQDDTVPLREREDAASDRIAELTLRKLREESAVKKKRFGKGALIGLVAAALLALSVTAYSSGVLSRVVNWRGRPVDSLSPPMSTMPPNAVMIGDGDRDLLIASILEQREGRELIIVRDGTSARKGSRNVPVSSIGELEELLSSEDSPLTIPVAVPEGYTLVTGRVTYEAVQGYEYTLISSETREDGLVVERYAVPVEGDFISCYQMEYENTSGEVFSLIGRMMPDTDEMEFGVWGSSSVVPLTVDGMDDALGIRNDGSSTITLRRKLASPIRCSSVYVLMGYPDPGLEYSEVTYHIWSQGMTVEELRALLVL